jgi:hypothetical protein
MVLPKYFKSLKIIEDGEYEKIVTETIHFLGFCFKIKTRHMIIPPNIHEIHILNGLVNGSSFIESYKSFENGTEITIDVNLKISGVMTIFSFLKGYIIHKMISVMDEFIEAAEAKCRSIN